jgi:peroxiredoxin
MNRARVFLVLSALLVFAVPAMADHHEKPHHGDMAPDFQLPDTSGTMHKLSDLRGKVVVLEWTSPKCPVVQSHYAENKTTMLDLQSKYGGEDVVWLAIDSSHFATAEDDAKWAKSKGIGYPILLDSSGEVGHMYDAKTTPHMFVIGRDGEILYDGAIDDRKPASEGGVNYVDAALSSVLAGEPVKNARTKPYGCSVKYQAKSAGAS